MKKILVVDDEKDIIISLKESLTRLDKDFEVTGVESGEECLEILKNNEKPDLIVLDIMMPGMDGWELFNRLKENYQWSKIPIVFLTAKNDEFTKTFGTSVASDFIEKPFDIYDLKNRINKILKEIKYKSTLER